MVPVVEVGVAGSCGQGADEGACLPPRERDVNWSFLKHKTFPNPTSYTTNETTNFYTIPFQLPAGIPMREETATRRDYNKLSLEDFDSAPCDGCPYCTVSTRGGIGKVVGYYCSYGIQNCFLYARWWHKKNAMKEEELDNRAKELEESLEKNVEMLNEYQSREKELDKERMAIELERDRIREVKSELKRKKRIIDQGEIEYEKFKKFIHTKKHIIEVKERKVDEMLMAYREEKENLETEKEELEGLKKELDSMKVPCDDVEEKDDEMGDGKEKADEEEDDKKKADEEKDDGAV